MEVILQERIRNLGAIGDEVTVTAGYARNCLLPQNKAIVANAHNRAAFSERRHELEARARESFEQAQAKATALEQLGSVTIKALASEEGKLFGSVGTREIADAVTAGGVSVEKIDVLLPMGAIRAVGEYEIQLQLHSDVVGNVKVVVVQDK